MPRIAWVSGAAGFIGRHVCRRLRDDGWTVVGFGRGNLDEEGRQAWGLTSFEAGTLRRDRLRQALATGAPDLVVHAAGTGSVGASAADPMADFHNTVGSTALMVDFCRRTAPGVRLVCLSSAAVYGNAVAAQPGPLSEDLPPRPISSYGWHKLMAETLCAQAAEQFGLTVRVVRLFSVYGIGQTKLLLYDLSRKLFAATDRVALFGHGGEMRDYLHVEDAAGLVVALGGLDAAKAKETGDHDGRFLLVNGGTGQGRSVRHVAETLCAAMAHPVELVFTGKTRQGDPEALVADTSRLDMLALRPRDRFEARLKAYADWLADRRDGVSTS